MDDTRTVLLVDNEPDVLESATSWLSQRGFQVETATKWTEAILRLQETPPDIVLLDLSLPTVRGEAILEFIREIDSDLPVVAISAGTDPDEIERLGALGASGFIRKPFGAEDLVVVVEQTLAESIPVPDEEEQNEEASGDEADLAETRPLDPEPPVPESAPEPPRITPGAGIGALEPLARAEPSYSPARRRRTKKVRSRRTRRIRNYILACVLFILIAFTIWIAQERLSGGFFGIGVTKSDV
ncbi:MAG: response regulator [Candidatus Latescibacteria bacterium]|nr:response regulator [Candidatus Latescibacterota bacterium]